MLFSTRTKPCCCTPRTTSGTKHWRSKGQLLQKPGSANQLFFRATKFEKMRNLDWGWLIWNMPNRGAVSDLKTISNSPCMRNEHCAQAQALGEAELSEALRTATGLSGIWVVRAIDAARCRPQTEPTMTADRTPNMGWGSSACRLKFFSQLWWKSSLLLS